MLRLGMSCLRIRLKRTRLRLGSCSWSPLVLQMFSSWLNCRINILSCQVTLFSMCIQVLVLRVAVLTVTPLLMPSMPQQYMNKGVIFLSVLPCGEVLGWLIGNVGSPTLFLLHRPEGSQFVHMIFCCLTLLLCVQLPVLISFLPLPLPMLSFANSLCAALPALHWTLLGCITFTR